MTSVRVVVRPEVLRWAMARSHRPSEAFDGFPVEAWLAEDRTPTLKQLESFARAVRAPVGLLLLDEPPSVELPLTDYRTLADARVSDVSPELLEAIDLVERRQAWYRELLESEGEPALGSVLAQLSTSDDPAATATHVTELLDYGVEQRGGGTWQDTRNRLVERLEAHGVLVMIAGYIGSTRRTFDVDEFRGFCLFDEYAPVIFVNARDTKAAQIFTLMHEFAHVLLGGSALDRPELDDARPGVEAWCNQVAANVLVPRADLSRQPIALGDMEQTLRGLADRYRASGLVILSQLHALGKLGWNDYARERDAERERAMTAIADRETSGGNYYTTVPHMISPTLLRAVVASTQNGTTQYTEAMGLLSASLKSVEGLIERVGAG